MYIRKIAIFICTILVPVLSNAQFSDYKLSTLEFIAEGGSGTVYSLDELSNAQNALAIRYYEGSGGATKNYQKAIYWFTQSANNGNKYAQYNLAGKYNGGIGVQKDQSKALYWYEKAAKQYYHEASLVAGIMYLNGEGTSKDYYKAANYFKDAAFGDLPMGMRNYAWCFANGFGVPVDSIKAVLWAERAIEKGDYFSYFILGSFYEGGLAVHKNINTAVYYYKKGAKNNDANSQRRIGYLYETGLGVNKDMNKALDYYIQSANNGNKEAMEGLARIYSDEDNICYDLSQAEFWYKKLIDKGFTSHLYDLRSVYKSMNKEHEIINVYELLASKGDTNALNSLAYIFAQGEGVQKDFKKALSYIEKAIEMAPDNMNYQDSKGEILLMMGDLNKAKQVWKLINKKQPYYFSEWSKANDGQQTEFYKQMKEKGY